MAIESREVVMYVRKATMSSIRVGFRSIRSYPYIWGTLFFILLLSRAFPSLVSFLVSSSPVIVCTAILVGTLLSYGTPNIPEIDEEDKKTQKISSMQTDCAVDAIFVKKDESFTVETHLETTREAAVAGTSNSASDKIGYDVPFAEMYNEGYGSDNTILTTRSLLHGEMIHMHSEMKEMKEREVAEREFSVNDQNKVEGLTIQIAKIASDSPFDSSLGSPWQPVDNFDASSGSDSDGAESSSPDASMADIIPMLDELDPLLKSEHSHATLSLNENSDSSSSGSSQVHELEEVENKENEIEESQEKDDPNEDAVACSENDQNNVMDLGYSEVERNQRLENLIARRRLRKLQRYVTEKNLIDLDSLYPTSIPSISAPRWNPFDLHYDYDGTFNLPPIPGSAPSVMQPRKNPFDFSYDQGEEINTISREYFRQENEDSTLIEPELHQGTIMLLSPVNHDADHVEQDKQSSEATVSVDNDRAVDFNTSVGIEETHLSAHSIGVMEGEIGEVENILPVSDARKLEVGEERYVDSGTSSSLEADEKSSRVNGYEESAYLEKKSCDSMQPKPGTENVIPNSLSSDVQADFALVSLPQRPSEADVSLEDEDLVVVRSNGEDLALGVVEMPESEAEKIMHSSCLSSLVSTSNEECMADVDEHVQSEGNKMINDLASIDESAVHLLPEARIEDSRISSLDLPSTIEENLEEDRKSVLQSPTSSDSAVSQVVDESNVQMLVVEQEEVGHDDLAIGQVPEEKSGNALVEPLIIPAHYDQFPGSDLAESMEFSNISDMMLKHDTNDTFSENESGFLRNIRNPDEDLDGEVSREADIDEGLLSELKCEEEGSNQEIGQLDTIVEDSCAESQDSRAFPIGEDPELTVYNSKLRVLEACSLEELDSVFKKHHDESTVPSMSGLTTEDLVDSESEMVPSEFVNASKNQEITDTDTEMLVLESKSVEDILEVLPEMSHLEAEETISDLHVVEAKSLEDINLSFEKHKNVLTEITANKIEQSSEASERNLEPEPAVVKSAEEINSDSAEQSSEISDGNENVVWKKESDNSSSHSGSSSCDSE